MNKNPDTDCTIKQASVYHKAELKCLNFGVLSVSFLDL